MKHETPQDEANEERVANAFAYAWHCQQVKSEDKHLDRIFMRNGAAIFLAEVKCRTNAWRKYSTYMVDYNKLAYGVNKAEQAGLPFLLIVRFTDGVRWTRVYPGDLETFERREGGRNDRGDPFDKDLCCYIPIDRLEMPT